MALASGYSAGAHIPLPQTFVQTASGSAVTTTYTLIGQVLYNSHTNFVGYNMGSAGYLMTSSAANAEQTTLADGNTYYVSEGKAPDGYLATGGSNRPMSTMAMTTSASEASSGSMSSSMAAETSGSDSMAASSSSGGESSSMTGSAAAATSSSSGNRLAAGAVFTVAFGLLFVFSMA